MAERYCAGLPRKGGPESRASGLRPMGVRIPLPAPILLGGQPIKVKFFPKNYLNKGRTYKKHRLTCYSGE